MCRLHQRTEFIIARHGPRRLDQAVMRGGMCRPSIGCHILQLAVLGQLSLGRHAGSHHWQPLPRLQICGRLPLGTPRYLLLDRAGGGAVVPAVVYSDLEVSPVDLMRSPDVEEGDMSRDLKKQCLRTLREQTLYADLGRRKMTAQRYRKIL